MTRWKENDWSRYSVMKDGVENRTDAGKIREQPPQSCRYSRARAVRFSAAGIWPVFCCLRKCRIFSWNNHWAWQGREGRCRW